MEIIIPIENIENENDCVLLKQFLSNQSEISNFKIEVNNSRALIITKKEEINIQKLIQDLKKIGYKIPTITEIFPVLEMSCASCANSVESILNSLPVVINATVNFASADVKVTYLPVNNVLSIMKNQVQSIGFDVIIEEKEDVDFLEELQFKKERKLKINTIGSLIFSTPLFIIGMFFMDLPYGNLIMGLLATPVVFIFGNSFFVNAYKQLKHRMMNMDTLVATSTGIAYIYSCFVTIFPHFFHEKGIHLHVYFEASAIIITFILLGKLLEDNAKKKTSFALKKLIGLQPKLVSRLKSNGEIEEVDIASILIEDVLIVKPGQKIAVDGIVLEGESYLDESMLTGEAFPIRKSVDNMVYTGTINQKGVLKYKASKVGKDTLLSQIIESVQNAQGSKAPVQKQVDKIASVFVPIVFIIALTTFFIWYFFGNYDFTRALVSFVTVLVIACPCALGLATPTAIMVGIGKSANEGILIKDAESLEIGHKVNTIVLDKTGTITKGHPVVTASFWKEDSDQLKDILFSIEKHSDHPLAQAIVESNKNNVNLVEHISIENIVGKGIQAKFDDNFYFVGNRRFLEENHVEFEDDFILLSEQWKNEGKSLVWFAMNNTVIAVYGIEDEVKETSIEAILSLKKAGIEVYMLTGDSFETARIIANKVGIDHFVAEVLPQEKADFIQKLQRNGKVVAMVGDGINDSSALAYADLGIAMGKGSDIAIEVAKMTIVSSDLNKISKALKISKATVQTIRQNLFWAFIYNVIGIPIAAGVLFPINGFLLNPMIAGAAMALSSVSVVSNSLILKIRKL